jgi:glycosyltransferase involved in cell wall biosynthesis
MLVSIIIPVYNSEKYLGRCIDSVLSQTYSHIEVVLVNDGSTDGSSLICERYAVKDSRVNFINQENKGVSAARNLGLRVAKGDYVGFIDSDDVVDSEMYKDVMEIAIKHNLEVVSTNYYGYEIGNINYEIIRNDIPYDKVIYNEQVKKYFVQSYYAGFLGIIPSTWTKVYCLSFLKENKIFFDEKLKRAEDYWFNFNVFLKASRVFAIDKAYYHYYKNEGSAMQMFREDDFENFIFNRTKLLEFNYKLGFNIDCKKFDKGFVIDCNEYILRAIKSNRKDLALTVLKNKTFQEAFGNIRAEKKHTVIIKKLLHLGLIKLAYVVYFVWSTKI